MIGPLDPIPAVAHSVATTAEQRRRQEANAYVHDALEALPEAMAHVRRAYVQDIQQGRAALAAVAVALMDVEAAELAARSVA